MAGYTPDELLRVQRIQQASVDATVGSGDSLGIPFMLAIFHRIVLLRDFAQAQQVINNQLHDRVRELEIRMGTQNADVSEVYLRIEPSGDDYVE